MTAIMSNKIEIWSFGGGLNSVAIGALIVQGKLPKPDVSVIVDTEREKSATWEYLENVIGPALSSVGVEIHRVKKSEFTILDLFSGADGNTLLIPTFSNKNGSVGKLANFCSNEWKQRVRDRYLRSIGITKKLKWIGFCLDEPRRWLRVSDDPSVRLPLVYDVPMRRRDCEKIVREMGWPPAPRSNCWMCPNQGDHEWRDIKENYPEDFAMAVKMEREIQKTDPFAFLHSSCIPLDHVDFTQEPDLFTRACNSGECFI